jgi:OOP family OmpA-OmpF porin
MSAAMLKLKDRKFDLIGHTDNQGLKATNQSLSQARAEAVKSYLTGKGINPDLMSASGQGADRPIAGNDNPEGRARNRRIEFRLAQ